MSEKDAAYELWYREMNALSTLLRSLEDIEADMRRDVIKCCDGRERMCDAFGCSNFTEVADLLAAARHRATEIREAEAEREVA